MRLGRRFFQTTSAPSRGVVDLVGRTPQVSGESPAPEGTIETSPATSVTQHGITITFNGSYPVGQFVNGDYFVLPNGSTYPQVTATSPAYSAATGMNGITVNPVHTGANGWRGVVSATGNQYNAALNVALSLPYQLAAGDAFMPSIGSTNGQHTNNRPYVERIIVLTCLATAPATGSFRPPYVAGSTKTLYNTDDIDWDVLPNVAAPATAPSWATVSGMVNNGPWIRLSTSNTGYRLIQPADQMQQYGRNIAQDEGTVLLRLMTNSTDDEKRATLYGAIQVGIEFYAIKQRFIDTGYSNAEGLGIWGQWSGGHGIGTKGFVFLNAAIMPSRTEFATACAHIPYQYWQPDGQVFVKTERESAGASSNAVSWLERYYEYDTTTIGVGERAFGATTNTTRGIPGYTFGSGVESTPPVPDSEYDASYHNMQGAAARVLGLCAQLMDAQDTYGWEPTLIWAEVYANGPEGGDGTSANGPNFTTFHRDMWNLHYVDEYT